MTNPRSVPLDPSRLDDESLENSVRRLQTRCAALLATMLVYLAEVDRRRLYARRGYQSMHGWAVGVLGLSEAAAYKQVQVARASKRHPVLLHAIGAGRLHLSGALLLIPHLDRLETLAERRDLIDAAAGKTKRHIEALLAARAPRPPVPTTIRKIPTPRDAAPDPAVPSLFDQPRPEPPANPPPQPAPPAPRPEPLSATTYKITFTAGQTLKDRMDEVTALLSHAVPNADLPTVLERALDIARDHLVKQRFGAKALAPGPADQAPAPAATDTRPTRYIPAAVRAAVWKRDQGRCTYTDPVTGHRCNSPRFLEIHHRTPHALQGSNTPDNLTLHCRTHNQLAAREDFGNATIDHHIANTRGQLSFPVA